MVPEKKDVEKAETNVVSARVRKARPAQRKGHLTEKEILKIAGGINPQPLPPHRA